MKRYLGTLFTATVLVCFLNNPAPAQAAEEPLGWYFEADLAGVWAAGNSESQTLGLGGKLRRLWTKPELVFTGGVTKTHSSEIIYTATGTTSDFTVQETKESRTTAEIYFVRGVYEYNFSPKFFTFGGADWLRNRFAGIDSRFLIAAGAGNTWSKTDNVTFKTYYSVTYTFEEDVVDNPFVKSDFPGARFGYDLKYKLSQSTDFESNLVADFNLDNTDDIRLDWYNALPVAISSKLLLQPSLRLLWRNEPALTNVPLEGTDETVPAQLKDLDSIFTLAIVLKLGPEQE